MGENSIEVFGLDGSFATVNCTLTPMKNISAETSLDLSCTMSPISQPKDSNNNVLDMSYNEDVLEKVQAFQLTIFVTYVNIRPS
ncbi:hypothetical protein DPMN_118088 [Dreissena polymorpha]|uniref:Uncharacterized protein n=1 Tax=Dreissena polymorpha TaxID=45954 RepID=A0A9D4GK57_DREPO|nr:hypothetical protein DPMN_118088 [Dreissena polymorpha]